jgi:CBS domain containing-hemolysin-like protein
LYSTRRGSLEALKSKDKKRGIAKKMIRMKMHIAEPIAAILILNTIANTAGATIAGMYAHKVLGAALIPLFSILFTLGILIIAEIVPKTIGAVYWRSIWPYIVWPLTIMKLGLYPLIGATQKLTDFITRGKATPPITEEDILGVVRLGAKEGGISSWESSMVHNIIDLENKTIKEIMTPRKVMFALDENLTVKKAHEIAGEKGFTRIPTYRDDKENITGYVMVHDLGSADALSKPDTLLSSIMKPMIFTLETINCLSLLNSFLKKRTHIAIVLDDYSGVAGLVTLEDLIEQVLGAEIVDETDKVVDMQKLARKRNRKDKSEKQEDR